MSGFLHKSLPIIMLALEQIQFAQKFLQGALAQGVKDELRLMHENYGDGLFDETSEDDFCVDVKVTVRDHLS
jgi:hypothetical protein